MRACCRRSIRAGTIVSALLISACQAADEAQVLNAMVANETTSVPRLPVAEAPLDRAAVLQAVAKAASAAALGHDDRAAQRGLDGDRFEVRIRFGCPGPTPSVVGSPFVVRYDGESRRLQVRASPDLTERESWVAAVGGDTIEAVEGFWMRKPWMLAPGCSVAANRLAVEATEDAGDVAQQMPMGTPEWRVGIAQFFRAADARTRRRDHRAYEATKTLDEHQPAPSQGYDIILAGRLQELPNGQVIACHVASAQLPPECVVSVTFDQVRIERADTQETLADWSS